MTITITGNKGEFVYNIVTDGEKCSIVEQDTEKILTRFGKISINGDASLEAKLATERACKTALSAETCCTTGMRTIVEVRNDKN